MNANDERVHAENSPVRDRIKELIAGGKETIPLIVGAIPFGIIFGALAIHAGLSVKATICMSAIVFAGSAQFISVGLIAQGSTLSVIVATTFLVNFRHVLYAASLAPYVKHLSHRWLVPLGFLLTDEAYAVSVRRYASVDESPYKHWYYLGSGLSFYLNWQACTLLGILAGRQLGNAAAWGLDFAMVVTFIGIVVPQIVTRSMVACALVAGVTSLVTNELPHKLGLMVASLSGIGAGAVLEALMARTNSERQLRTWSDQ
jgi:4-azaleucine resistance transporter AzlC